MKALKVLVIVLLATFSFQAVHAQVRHHKIHHKMVKHHRRIVKKHH